MQWEHKWAICTLRRVQGEGPLPSIWHLESPADEYELLPLQPALDLWSAAGWELAAVQIASARVMPLDGSHYRDSIYIWKRPVATEPPQAAS
jgi:hypothetical protein